MEGLLSIECPTYEKRQSRGLGCKSRREDRRQEKTREYLGEEKIEERKGSIRDRSGEIKEGTIPVRTRVSKEKKHGRGQTIA